MEIWQLQTAKARLSELVKKAVSQGPQMITVRGEPEVVVLSKSEYDPINQAQTFFGRVYAEFTSCWRGFRFNTR